MVVFGCVAATFFLDFELFLKSPHVLERTVYHQHDRYPARRKVGKEQNEEHDQAGDG